MDQEVYGEHGEKEKEMSTYEILMDIMQYVRAKYPEKIVRMVLYGDLSGHFAYMYDISGKETESRLFGWERGYESLFKNFVKWIVRE